VPVKNVYMFQPNYLYGNQAHIPYAIGVLAAYAWHEEEIKENYELKKLQFAREDTDAVVAGLDNPFIAAFSTYMWNYGYNTLLARKVKEKYPDCIIIFGGHQLPEDGSIPDELSFADIFIQGEGEVPFLRILRSYIGLEELEKIPNLVFRKDNKTIKNPREYYTISDYPSPYLEGTFDKLIEENPGIKFVFLFETNRGCPYHCAYCDWGTLKGRMRMFSEERTIAELDWMADHEMEFCGNADSNFGLFERDLRYIDHIIELKNTKGYPLKFQASFAKNNGERIFEIGRRLSENGMNKGITLSFQTLCEEALAIIGRENVKIEFFRELLNMYNEAGIPTYTELILGLPGESYSSFADGMNELLCAGQHHSIYIHNLEMLPQSDLGSAEYAKKYAIETRRIPINEPHRSYMEQDDIPEYSSVVTGSFSMNSADWVKTCIFSDTVQCFHHLGLLQFFAIYCYNEFSLSYRSFYEKLLDFIFSSEGTVACEVLSEIKHLYEEVVNGTGSLTAFNEKFGDITWSFNEFAFLSLISRAEEFYKEIRPFTLSLGIDPELADEMLRFQKFMQKKPEDKSVEKITSSYDFYTYFSFALNGRKAELIKKETTVARKAETFDSVEAYARNVVWYGRKDSRNIYINESGIIRSGDE